MIFYEHKQKGGRWFYSSFFILLLFIPIFYNISAMMKCPGVVFLLPVLAIIVATIIWTILTYSSLTVTIDNEFIHVVFGPYAFFKRFALKDIASCKPVKNSFWDSWGIHMCGSGWLYNIAGFDAVEITMKSGKHNRIGTDEPQQLAETIQNIIAKISTGGK
jgi:hypothetical protein